MSAATPRKKKGGLLGLLVCCAAPEPGAPMESIDNVQKVDRLPVRPTTARSSRSTRSRSRTPMEQPSAASGGGSLAVVTEKDSPTTTGPESSAQEKRVSDSTSQGIPTSTDDTTAAQPIATPPVINEPKSGDEPVAVPEPPVRSEEPEWQQAEQPDDYVVEQSEDEPAVPPSPQPTSSVPLYLGLDDAASEQSGLLPPVRPEHKGRKCLVLDLDETLVHSSFKMLTQADFTIPVEIEGNYHNVYVIKRPGVDEFMRRMGELYEVVVFTASVSKYGDPLLDQLDIHKVVHHRLFRESCYNNMGNYVKDLSQIGRPLEDTIIIDNSPASYAFHPQHAVPISSWFSDAHDNELLDLIPVLEDLAGSAVRDVTLVLDVKL